jgi:hypothetical protein
VKRFVSLQFLNLRHRYDSLDGESARRKPLLNTNKHPCLEWNSNPQSQCSSVQAGEDISCLRPRGHCTRQRFAWAMEFFFLNLRQDLVISCSEIIGYTEQGLP